MIPLDFTFGSDIWRCFHLHKSVFSRSGLGSNHNHHVTLMIVFIGDSFRPREKTSCSTAVSRSRRVRGALVFAPLNHGKLAMDAAWHVQVLMPLMMMLMVLLLLLPPPPLLLLTLLRPHAGAAAEDYSRQIRCSACRMLLLTCDACSEGIYQRQQHNMLCELCSDRQSRVVTLRAILDGDLPLAISCSYPFTLDLPPSSPSFPPSAAGCEVALQQLTLPPPEPPKQQFRKHSSSSSSKSLNMSSNSKPGPASGCGVMEEAWGAAALALIDAMLERCNRGAILK
jgi:hypothetical protein